MKAKPKKTLRTCPNGHCCYKSSDCPACPVCESAKKPEADFLLLLSAPARRAMENAGIQTLQQLANYSQKEILQLHGIGKTSLPVLAKALEAAGLGFQA